jgi:hypothetical protein
MAALSTLYALGCDCVNWICVVAFNLFHLLFLQVHLSLYDVCFVAILSSSLTELYFVSIFICLSLTIRMRVYWRSMQPSYGWGAIECSLTIRSWGYAGGLCNAHMVEELLSVLWLLGDGSVLAVYATLIWLRSYWVFWQSCWSAVSIVSTWGGSIQYVSVSLTCCVYTFCLSSSPRVCVYAHLTYILFRLREPLTFVINICHVCSLLFVSSWPFEVILQSSLKLEQLLLLQSNLCQKWRQRK